MREVVHIRDLAVGQGKEDDLSFHRINDPILFTPHCRYRSSFGIMSLLSVDGDNTSMTRSGVPI